MGISLFAGGRSHSRVARRIFDLCCFVAVLHSGAPSTLGQVTFTQSFPNLTGVIFETLPTAEIVEIENGMARVEIAFSWRFDRPDNEIGAHVVDASAERANFGPLPSQLIEPLANDLPLPNGQWNIVYEVFVDSSVQDFDSTIFGDVNIPGFGESFFIYRFNVALGGLDVLDQHEEEAPEKAQNFQDYNDVYNGPFLEGDRYSVIVRTVDTDWCLLRAGGTGDCAMYARSGSTIPGVGSWVQSFTVDGVDRRNITRGGLSELIADGENHLIEFVMSAEYADLATGQGSTQWQTFNAAVARFEGVVCNLTFPDGRVEGQIEEEETSETPEEEEEEETGDESEEEEEGPSDLEVLCEKIDQLIGNVTDEVEAESGSGFGGVSPPIISPSLGLASGDSISFDSPWTVNLPGGQTETLYISTAVDLSDNDFTFTSPVHDEWNFIRTSIRTYLPVVLAFFFTVRAFQRFIEA